MGLRGSLRLPARLPQCFDIRGLVLKPSKCIKKPTMRRRVDQGTLIVLAMDLDQRTPELPEHLHADRLIVHKGTRAAIGKLNTAEDQLIVRGNIIGSEQRACRM